MGKKLNLSTEKGCRKTLLLAWSLVCSAGIADEYYGQNLISVLFNV